AHAEKRERIVRIPREDFLKSIARRVEFSGLSVNLRQKAEQHRIIGIFFLRLLQYRLRASRIAPFQIHRKLNLVPHGDAVFRVYARLRAAASSSGIAERGKL